MGAGSTEAVSAFFEVLRTKEEAKRVLLGLLAQRLNPDRLDRAHDAQPDETGHWRTLAMELLEETRSDAFGDCQFASNWTELAKRYLTECAGTITSWIFEFDWDQPGQTLKNNDFGALLQAAVEEAPTAVWTVLEPLLSNSFLCRRS